MGSVPIVSSSMEPTFGPGTITLCYSSPVGRVTTEFDVLLGRTSSRTRNTLIEARARCAELKRKESFHNTTLTSRQWEVIRYRAQGMTQAELAKRLRTSRENVNEIEHRARQKINKARATLIALQNLEGTGVVLVPSGTSIFEAVCMVFMRADILGVKLRTNADEMLASMREGWKGKIGGHRLTSAAKMEIASDGTLVVKRTA